MCQSLLPRTLGIHNEPKGAQDTNYSARMPLQRPWHAAPQLGPTPMAISSQFPLSFLSAAQEVSRNFALFCAAEVSYLADTSQRLQDRVG